ncbi:IS66 family transposase [Burkholderia cenocepacia]|nr:IS66 family transposase [Burkholderia cenocepacia]
MAASGFVAHTLISRFVDHMPYYLQETVNARSGVYTPRSTLVSATGQPGCALVISAVNFPKRQTAPEGAVCPVPHLIKSAAGDAYLLIVWYR